MVFGKHSGATYSRLLALVRLWCLGVLHEIEAAVHATKVVQAISLIHGSLRRLLH